MDKPINSHDPTSWDWEDNILTQKSSGPESVGLGEGAKHRKASLNDLRSRVVETKDVVNNLITIEPGKVADARQLKVLKGIGGEIPLKHITFGIGADVGWSRTRSFVCPSAWIVLN